MSNFTNGLAIITALVVAVARLLKHTWADQVFETAVLACLGVIATSMYLDRAARTEFEKNVRAMAANRRDINDLLIRFADLGLLKTRIQNVSEIWVSGFVMSTFLLTNERTLIEWFKGAGGRPRRLKVLFGPDGILGATSMQHYGDATADELEAKRRTSLEILRRVKRDHGKDGLEYRFSRVVPPHNLLILDPEGDCGVQVHLNVVDIPSEESVLFCLSRAETPSRVALFKSEFDHMWAQGERPAEAPPA